MTTTIEHSEAVTVPGTESWVIRSPSGNAYLIQIGFPRNSTNTTPTCEEAQPVSILYLTDGNSVFLSAVECLQRRLSSQRAAFSTGVVVAIAYPLPSDSKSVMSHRRAFDLTPPSPGCDPSEGGADAFLDFIQFHVKPFVHHRVSAILGAKPGKEALYGHSYGGLFCLHSLFTRPDTFDCFIVSSPSIWWNNEFVLREEQTFRDASGKTRPDLLLFVGGLEQDPPRQRGENDIEYHKRQKRHQERKMVENVLRQHERLCKSGRLGRLSAKVYDGEDHGTVIGCSLSQGLATFFEDWPLSIG